MKRLAIACVLLVLFTVRIVAAEPVRIVVGYQPYDTISYSAVVIRALQLWRKYLPPDVEVVFEEAMQGPVIVRRMQTGSEQIGYLGDMPALVAAGNREIAAIKLVASTGFSQGQRCGIVMVRADAPLSATPQESMAWLDGKRIGVSRGTCADRFLRILIDKRIVRPSEVSYHSPEVLAAKLYAGALDGVVVWESTASRLGVLVGEGVARIVATGHTFDLQDAGALVMREDFMRKYPALAEGWLKTELEAQRYILDPKNQHKVAQFVSDQTVGVSPRMAWFSLYGAIPASRGGGPVRDEKRFVFDPEVRRFFEQTHAYLQAAKTIPANAVPADVFDDTLARRVAAQAGVTLPLGVIIPAPISAGPK